MSGKLDKNDADNYSTNSKVLKKARSFRDDIKHRIIRKNPSSPKDKPVGNSVQGERLSTSASSRSPKLSKSKLQRGSSFKEDCKTEKVQKTDVEKLKTEDRKVHHALLGLRVVVEKGMLHMLPGSATVVLETVMEVLQLLGNFFVETDSSALLSAYKQVNQSVANLMKWSDEILLGDKEVDKDTASSLIQGIEQGMKDLMKLATEKLENKSSQKSGGGKAVRSGSPGVTLANGSARSDSKKRSSLPDIALTPQEEKGLNLMTDATTTQQPTVVKVVKGGESEGTDISPDEPPPKPPLPANFGSSLVYSARPPNSQPANAAPPLPPKKRTGSSSSIYDNYDGSAVDTLWSQVAIGNGNKQHQKEGSVTSDGSTLTSYNPADLLRGSSFSDSSGVFSDISSSDVSQTSKPAASTDAVDFEPGELFAHKPRALSDDLTLKADSRPESVSSQLSRNSNTDVSTVDNLQAVAFDKSDARLSHYDNFAGSLRPPAVTAQKSSHFEIQNLTEQIEQLTVSVESDSFSIDKRPPLPVKKNSPSLPKSAGPTTQKQPLSHSQLGVVREHFANRSANALSQYDNFHGTTSATTAVEVASASGSRILQHQPFPLVDTSLIMHTSPELRLKGVTRDVHHHTSSMVTSHSAYEFSSSSSSATSSSNSSGSFRKVNTNHHHQVTSASYSAVEKQVTMKGGGAGPQEEMLVGRQSVSATRGRASLQQQHTVIGMGEGEGGLLKPPPLPPKKKTVEAYMQIVGQYTMPNVRDLSRHSINAVSFYQTMWQQHQLEMFHQVNFNRSNTLSMLSDISSARNSDVFSIHSASSDDTGPPTPPFPPRLPIAYSKQPHDSSSHDVKSRAKPVGVKSYHADSPPREDSNSEGKVVQVVVQNGSGKEEDSRRESSVSSVSTSTSDSNNPTTVTTATTSTKDVNKDRESVVSDVSSVLEEVDVTGSLVRQKQGEDEPEIRGGSLDALIVHATAAGRKEILYQEAFLTTYRTFIKSRELIEHLLYRYNYFCRMDTKKKKVARNTFSLLVRVVDELCTEIDNDILQVLMDIVHQLVSQGELMLAKILRRKVLEKVEQKKQMQLDNTHHMTLWESHHMTTKQYSLLEFKPETIAEQMTLLDAELFQKIEIPEVLLWAKDQNEEQSPNLTEFTEHFNKMSYWCRTQILQQEDAKEREKYLVKFIKIMKFLRKYNNFNSYLAVLSAVDSAPVRRLEWQKQNVEALQELSHLIDSSSSFRAYRHELAETEPPCIPYIGIILQDLTFVHIGNPDFLSEGCINFSKRWQQFGILDNMKRFKAAEYNFKKNHKIIAFFNGFDENLSEESLWQISEVLKPRGSRKKPES